MISQEIIVCNLTNISRLIRLMSSSNAELKNLSTKFLFILCKENGKISIGSFNQNHPCVSSVNRLNRYPGLSNANELLYDVGILNLQETSNKEQYSSDSDEFDTENDRITDDQYA